MDQLNIQPVTKTVAAHTLRTPEMPMGQAPPDDPKKEYPFRTGFVPDNTPSSPAEEDKKVDPVVQRVVDRTLRAHRSKGLKDGGIVTVVVMGKQVPAASLFIKKGANKSVFNVCKSNGRFFMTGSMIGAEAKGSVGKKTGNVTNDLIKDSPDLKNSGKGYIRNGQTELGVRAKNFLTVHFDIASLENMLNKFINSALSGQSVNENHEDGSISFIAAPSTVDICAFNETSVIMPYDQFGDGPGTYAAFDISGKIDMTLTAKNENPDPVDIVVENVLSEVGFEGIAQVKVVGPLPEDVDHVLVDNGSTPPVFVSCENREDAINQVSKMIEGVFSDASVKHDEFNLIVKKNG